ncbi:hypothetical protein L1889_03680 [Paenalcaligenes niemegkensis]|uniref:hypothetical protein n=1 Tax=Paenalcaligenes niemegkensis TaxID=2895469 RepID=UPI001EE7E64B|nr:hypothetical protein [Paenalcaligenes niemegkensis]MCQ9615910.1 hypothetical protein [Paenalcaligenes niemegkensis]
MNNTEIAKLRDHHNDLLNALLILELICEATPCSKREDGLIELGKMAIGSKMELLSDLIHKAEKGGQHEAL